MSLLNEELEERIAKAVARHREGALVEEFEEIEKTTRVYKTPLTPDEVRAIRASEESISTLAARFGVCRDTIFLIRNRERHKRIL